MLYYDLVLKTETSKCIQSSYKRTAVYVYRLELLSLFTVLVTDRERTILGWSMLPNISWHFFIIRTPLTNTFYVLGFIDICPWCQCGAFSYRQASYQTYVNV